MNIEMVQSNILSSILRSHVYNNLDLNLVMASGLVKEWFEHPTHASMFEVMKLLYERGTGFDDIIILDYMEKSGNKDAQDIMLSIMAQSILPNSVVMEYIDLLKEHNAIKRIEKLKKEIEKMLLNDNRSELVIQVIQHSIDQYVLESNVSATSSLREVRNRRKALPPVQRIRTYIPFIDTVLTGKKHSEETPNVGIRNEGLFFISGLKESGKTFVATRIIENVSKDHPVLFGSMEFGEDLYDENIEEQDEEGFFEGNIDNIYTFDKIYEVHAIAAEIRLQHKLRGIKLVVLDSMLRITNSNPDLKTDEKRISETFSILGMVSKELKIPIIIIVQSSKEDLKSSMVSVKGSMSADHEAYVWFHLTKTNPKDHEDELRTVIWVKNKDTKKHPKQLLMFVPQTSDFYRVEIDEHGNAGKALDKFRRPPPKAIEIVYETKKMDVSLLDCDPYSYDMPTFV